MIVVEFIVQNSGDQKIYDFSTIVYNIEYSGELNQGASKLTFSYHKQGVMLSPGSIVRFKYKGQKIFYGYVFDSINKKDHLETVAFDQLRYWKNKDTVMLKNSTLDSLIHTFCNKFNLLKGDISKTGFVLKNQILKNKTILDMVSDAASDTLIATKKKYCYRDEFGYVSLYDLEDLRLPLIFGDLSFATDYQYSRSIDGDTYNRIKLVQKRGDTLVSTVSEDQKTQSKWGILQYYEEVDERVGQAQIKKKAEDLLRLYNREERKFTMSLLGDSRVKEGNSFRVILPNLQIDQYCIVEKVTHKFGNVHTMEVTLLI